MNSEMVCPPVIFLLIVDMLNVTLNMLDLNLKNIIINPFIAGVGTYVVPATATIFYSTLTIFRKIISAKHLHYNFKRNLPRRIFFVNYGTN